MNKKLKEYVLINAKNNMKKLFEKWFCLHKWFTYKDIKVDVIDENNNIIGKYSIIILICEKCGKITKIKSN